MTIPEFSDQMDVLYGNITSNQAPGLSEFEKSLFLTKAEKEIVKNYFTANSKGNTLGQGFDDSAKRQADFSILMKTAECTPCSISDGNITIKCYNFETDTSDPTPIKVTKVTDAGGDYDLWPGSYQVTYVNNVGTITDGQNIIEVESPDITANGTLVVVNQYVGAKASKIDPREDTKLYSFPKDTFIVVNETITAKRKKFNHSTPTSCYLQVIPLRYDEYTRLMSKPYKRPLKNQAWRLINSGTIVDDEDLQEGEAQSQKFVEIITAPGDTIDTYSVRYVRTPKPIILSDLEDGLTIDGCSKMSDKCEIDPILHEDILQRAVELAKIAWTQTGQDNAQAVMTAGQRSE